MQSGDAYKQPLLDHFNASDNEERRKKRGDLGRTLTFEFKKVEKVLQDEQKDQSVTEVTLRQVHKDMNDAARKLHYYCELITSSYSEQDIADNKEGYERSKTYWKTNYGATYTDLTAKLQDLTRAKTAAPVSTGAAAAPTTAPGPPTVTATTSGTLEGGHGNMEATDTSQLGAIRRRQQNETPLNHPSTQGHTPTIASLVQNPPIRMPNTNPTFSSQAPHSSTFPMGDNSYGNHFGAIGEGRRTGINWVGGPTDQGIDRNRYPSLMEVSGNAAGVGQDRYLTLFSQSLASTYSITKVIHKKFDGNPEAWPEFELLLVKSSDQMDAMAFSQGAKLLELRKIVSGPALDYIQNIPITEQNCFDTAFQLLRKCFYANQSQLTTLVKKLLKLDVTNGSFQSRQHLHSSVVSYVQGTRAIGASPQQILNAIEICLVESRLDKKMKDDWYRLCAAKRDVNHVLGFDVDMNDMLNRIHQTMLQQQRQESSLDIWDETKPRFRTQNRKPFHAFAVAAGTPKKIQVRPKFGSAPAGKPNQGGSQQSWSNHQRPQINQGTNHNNSASIIVKCPFCKTDTSTTFGKEHTQKFIHRFPLSCKRIRDKEISNEDILKIVKKYSCCINCFSPFHSSRFCDQTYLTCGKDSCGKKHNYRLHGLNFSNIKPS